MKPNKFISICILGLGFSLLFFIRDLGPVARLMYASIGLIGLIKLSVLFIETEVFKSKLGLFLYIFTWPGISTEGFKTRRKKPLSCTGERFLENWISFLTGSFILILCLHIGRGRSIALNYLSLISILFILHMGLVDIWGDLLKLIGFAPNRMFDRPFRADSLRSFWSHRWNKAFVEMNKCFFVTPLKGKIHPSVLAFFIFFVSGVLHEIGISYSSGSNFGLPLLYFLVQGTGFVLEKKFCLGRTGTILFVLLPLPILFPPTFVNLYFGMLADLVFGFIENIVMHKWISFGLLIGGILQFIVLIASVQVPGKLDWKRDLSQLNRFNRKVFWTYGGYIFCIIIFMATLSIIMSYHESFEFGSKVWLLFIILFWTARVLIDIFYYTHEDWPKGPEFVIGHICLTTLFISLVCLYSAVLVVIV